MKQNNTAVEPYRLTREKVAKRNWNPRVASDATYGNNGMFLVPRPKSNCSLLIQASDTRGWEHVSVSIYHKDRTPTWEEMCFIKDLFWEKGEVVVQYHPAEADYVNNHEHCLHLWKPTTADIPTPPASFVGIKGNHEHTH